MVSLNEEFWDSCQCNPPPVSHWMCEQGVHIMLTVHTYSINGVHRTAWIPQHNNVNLHYIILRKLNVQNLFQKIIKKLILLM